MRISLIRTLALVAALAVSTTAAAAFQSFVIRTGGAPSFNVPVIQPNNVYVPGATEFIIAEGGQKAGLGSSDIDGSTLGNITNVSIARLDDSTRFDAGSGPRFAPYLNFWITDGLGNYAVVANEPTDPAFQPLYSNGYNLSWADLANKVAKVYENADLSWLPITGSSGLPAQPGRQNPLSANMYTFADLAGYIVEAPSVAQLAASWPGLGSGAPRELGTNVARGVNWIFGDTLASYVSGAEGYVVTDAAVAAPAPTYIQLIVTPSTPVFGSDDGGVTFNDNVNGVPGDYAPGYAGGSLASNGIAKTDMYFPPAVLFGRDVAVGEVASMSYFTKNGTTHAVDPRDWFLAIYTMPFTGDQSSASWYGARFGTEPYFSVNRADPANAWNEWTTDGATNRLRFFESTAGAPGANFGSYTDPDWVTFIGGNSLGTTVPRRNQQVLYFSVQTGSAWAAGFTGQVDGFMIELTDGSVATVNFEADVMAVKAAVLADLQPLLSLPKPNSDKVKSAIDHINKSLNPKFWADATHLTKDGKPVFDEEKKAVHSLEEVVPPNLVLDAINALVGADRALATIAIAESTKKQSDIDKANNEIAKGDADAANGKYEEAIGHYKNAWDLAT